MKLYVGNIPFSMDENKLRSLFEEFGTVQSVNVITERETGRARGFAFVEMPDDDGKKAMAELNEKQIDGRALNVNEARAREDRGSRSGGGGRY